MKRTRLIMVSLSASLVILTSLVGLRATHLKTEAHPEEPWHASWQFRPETPGRAKQLSTMIFHGRVSEVQQAADIVAQTPNGDQPRTPTQRIFFEVLKPIYGNPSQAVRVWHMGTDTIHFEGDPPYRVGEEYVLFVYPNDESGTHVVLSPECRYRVAQGRLEPVSEVDWTLALRGKSVSDLEQLLD